ncbi:MAG: LacI family DNA-binding transcriptional regulator [Hespellia sp.]|nr:LacI family DNA-binding transcriptional regulator [Hespellia sp.]
MRIKNKEIAEKLGISVTAVSLAINNRPGVSEETRQKVIQLINESLSLSPAPHSTINYSGNNSVGSILLSVHKKHGHVINDKPFFSNLLETCQQEAMKSNYALTIAHYIPGQNIDEYIEYIRSLKIDGIVVMATEIDNDDLSHYRSLNIPLVLLDGSFDLADVDSVALDNQTAIFRAFDYGYQLGHRNIGFLKSEVFINNFGHHFDGFMKGIRTYNLDEYNHPVIELPCSIEGAYNQMKEFLANPPANFQMPTLFLADLDFIALGAMQAIKEAGYSIPDDISFIGYDDVSACEIFDPPLTTTRVNRMDVGRIATRRLIQKMNRTENYYTTTQVSSELIIRKSVKNINN